MKESFTVGLVGYGFASRTFHAPLIQATPGLELAAVSSSDADKVRADLPEVTVDASPQALFARSDIDLVVIPTPNESHFPLAKAALSAGKHVVVDKPFTVTLSEARQLRSQAERAGKLLSVFHNRRWDSDFMTVRDLLRDATLGRVVHFESHFDRFRPDVRPRWREQAKPGGGIWYDLGPHLLDQAHQLFGMPQAILVDLAMRRDGAQVDDDFHALLDYGDMRVVLHAAALVAAESPRFVVHGTRGSYVKYGLDPQEARLKAGEQPSPRWGSDPRDGTLTLADEQGGLDSRVQPTQPGDYLAYYAGVRDALRGEQGNPVALDDALAVMQLLEVGLDSARQKRWVRLKEGALRKST
ncbi:MULTISPECIES: oxidoreductase [unclassified Modicisalibacter]|uniref:oxidoreductase n=1 Tax=unclassified Modicisalibacter TaxID=2679913 RepID=UPI001CCDC58F|nr:MULTISPECIES: oxidoreductase [unclassified Modicisalibacter]MBZ9557539.1 oxidoreductase [Modicisalibacter sp. R2A 31.J]MBZ9573796.1 oxidoreductase [Modicisalibacter sp. MOD 31.J]